MAKYYLDENGVRKLVNAFDASLSYKADKTDLDSYATKSDIEDIETDLEGYATQDYVNNKVDSIEEYDDTEVRNMIENLEAKTSGLYHFKGSVENLLALEAIEDPEVGDTYNLLDTGMNAAWTGSEWDEFGSVADLSDYLKTEDVLPIGSDELDAILYGGKSAVISDISGFNAMMANDETEVTVVLDSDIDLGTSLLNIPATKKVTLNLNGKTITATGTSQAVQVLGEVTLINGTINAKSYGVGVFAGGKLTVDGTTIKSTASSAINATGDGAKVIVNSGTITAQEVGVLAMTNADVVINGGYIQGLDNFAVGSNGSSGKGGANVTINGGILEGHIQSAGYIAAAIYWPNSGILTINGGSIVSDGAGIVMRGGTVNLNAGTSIVANGATGVYGKVGDSSVTVGPFAVVYDQKANYPAVDSLQLNIAKNVVLQGTDGDIDVLLSDGATANIVDNR